MALKMQQINREIEDLQRQKKEVQANIAGGASNNAALLQRFRYILHWINGSHNEYQNKSNILIH